MVQNKVARFYGSQCIVSISPVVVIGTLVFHFCVQLE